MPCLLLYYLNHSHDLSNQITVFFYLFYNQYPLLQDASPLLSKHAAPKRNKSLLQIPKDLTICPHCGSTLEQLIGDNGNWCERYCPNEQCYGRNIETAVKFFTIAQMDGFGDKKVTQIANDFILNYSNCNKELFCRNLKDYLQNAKLINSSVEERTAYYFKAVYGV